MIAAIAAWWRREPVKPPEQQYTACNVIGVGGHRLTVEQENDERLRLIFERLSRGHMIEIEF